MHWLLDTPSELSPGLEAILSTLKGLGDELDPEVTSALAYILKGHSSQSINESIALIRESLDHDERALVDAIDVLLKRVPSSYAKDFLDRAHVTALERLKERG